MHDFVLSYPGLYTDGVAQNIGATPLLATQRKLPGDRRYMSSYYVKLAETVRLAIDTMDQSGQAVNADSTPTVTVLDQGTAMGYAATVTNKAVGLYEVALVLTGGNGFAVNHEYSIYTTYAVGGFTKRVPLASLKLINRSPDDLAYPVTSGRSMAVNADGTVEMSGTKQVYGTITIEQLLRLIADSNAGRASGFGTGTILIKSQDGVKTRATITVDSTGRTAVVIGDLS